MKPLIYPVIILTLFLTACNKKDEVKFTKEIFSNENEETTPSFNYKEINAPMYVSASGGLRVRDNPDINGNRIAILEDQAEIVAIKEVENSLNIDGIEGKWTFIEYGDIQGWVFGGYLTFKPSHITTQALESFEDTLSYIFFEILKFDDNWDGTIRNKFNANTYRIIRQWTSLDTRGRSAEEKANMPDNVILSFVEYDQFMVAYITSLINTPDTGRVNSLEVKINDTNYLHLFPYLTVNEILLALKDRNPNYGIYKSSEYYEGYANEGDEFISFMPWDHWTVYFKNGQLSSIRFASLQP